MSYQICISLKEMTAYINRYVTYTFIFIILSITISELHCVRGSILLLLYRGGGDAIEGCLASAIAFSDLFMELYYLYLKYKHVYEWFSIVLHLVLILTVKCVRFVHVYVPFFFFSSFLRGESLKNKPTLYGFNPVVVIPG